METRPRGSEPRRGLLLAQKCFAPKRPFQEEAEELPGRWPVLGDLLAGKQRPLCNAFGWGWVELFVCGGRGSVWVGVRTHARLRRGRGGRENRMGEGM